MADKYMKNAQQSHQRNQIKRQDVTSHTIDGHSFKKGGYKYYWNPTTQLMRIENYRCCGKCNGPQEVQPSYHVTQQVHSWVCTQEN